MHRLHSLLPAVAWQMLLMGLLGLSGIIFVPLLLRVVDAQLIATVLVAQVYVYYLSVLVQFGFALSGPAVVARAVHAADLTIVWRSSVRFKLLLAGPVAVLFCIGYACMARGQWHMWWFAMLLASYALNSNWWLQAQQRFAPAVAFAAFGVMSSALVVYGLVSGHLDREVTNQGSWLVLVLVLPQVCVGAGTWWVARRTCAELMPVSKVDANHSESSLVSGLDFINWLRTDTTLVASQLLILAPTTLGTVVVGMLADASTTAAYASIEKLFNLAATVLVGVFMALYPRLAGLFYANRELYKQTTQRLLLICVSAGFVFAALLAWVGPHLIWWYLPEHMAGLVTSTLWPFGLWLGLYASQHLLTSHLVLAERKHMVLWTNAAVLLVTGIVGLSCALGGAVSWVYGMVAGQVFALVWLLRLFQQEKGADT